MALASYSDAYFGIFCILMGAFLVGWRFTAVRWDGRDPRLRVLVRGLDAAIVFTSAAIAWRLVQGPAVLVLGPMAIRFNTLYTAMLLLLVCVLARAWLTWRPVPILHTPPEGWWRWIRLGLVAVGTCLLLLLPALIATVGRSLQGLAPQVAALLPYVQQAVFGLVIILFLVLEPQGLAKLWRNVKDTFRLWPFSY